MVFQYKISPPDHSSSADVDARLRLLFSCRRASSSFSRSANGQFCATETVSQSAQILFSSSSLPQASWRRTICPVLTLAASSHADLLSEAYMPPRGPSSPLVPTSMLWKMKKDSTHHPRVGKDDGVVTRLLTGRRFRGGQHMTQVRDVARSQAKGVQFGELRVRRHPWQSGFEAGKGLSSRRGKSRRMTTTVSDHSLD